MPRCDGWWWGGLPCLRCDATLRKLQEGECPTLPEELVALCQWPPTAAQAALWMQVLSMEGGRGLHASTANETVSLFSNFMADAKCRVLFQQGSLSYEEMLAAKADGRYSARVLAGQVFRGATYGLQRENPREKRPIPSKNDVWQVRGAANSMRRRCLMPIWGSDIAGGEGGRRGFRAAGPVASCPDDGGAGDRAAGHGRCAPCERAVVPGPEKRTVKGALQSSDAQARKDKVVLTGPGLLRVLGTPEPDRPADAQSEADRANVLKLLADLLDIPEERALTVQVIRQVDRDNQPRALSVIKFKTFSDKMLVMRLKASLRPREIYVQDSLSPLQRKLRSLILTKLKPKLSEAGILNDNASLLFRDHEPFLYHRPSRLSVRVVMPPKLLAELCPRLSLA